MMIDFNREQDLNSDKMNPTLREHYQKVMDYEISRRAHPPRFIPAPYDEDADFPRYMSEDIKGFYGDCEDCVHYSPLLNDYDSGCGKCDLDGSYWGYSFTCEHHRFKESALYFINRIEEQLKKEDGENCYEN